MKKSWLYRLVGVLCLTAVMLGIETVLANGFNAPRAPFEATLCLIGLVVVFAVYILVIYDLSKKWSKTNEEVSS